MLMQCCAEKVRQTGYAVGNVDAVVIAQEPKIGPHTEHMTHHIAQALGIEPAQVNIKATTTEHMGFTDARRALRPRRYAYWKGSTKWQDEGTEEGKICWTAGADRQFIHS